MRFPLFHVFGWDISARFLFPGFKILKPARKSKPLKISKASLTIEAVCIMTLVLFTIVGTIYLCLFIHNRTWLTAAAYEAALTGSMQTQDDKALTTAQTKARSLGNTGLFGGENLKCSVQCADSVEVVYSMDTKSAFGGLLWHFQAKGSSKILKPVQWIRKIKAASEIMKKEG